MQTVIWATCPQCNSAFQPRRANQRFCRAKCKWTHTNANRVLRPNTHAVCKVCGVAFSRYVEPSKLAAGLATAEYCGRACKGKALSGERHPLWKGGRITEADGYVMLFRPKHPNTNNKGYVFEHRLVMEAVIGRPLLTVEVVHHIDGNRSNNRVENLQLFASNADHKKEAHESERQRNTLGQYLPTGG